VAYKGPHAPHASTCASHRAFLGYSRAVTRAFLPDCTPKLANYFYYLIVLGHLRPVQTVWKFGGKNGSVGNGSVKTAQLTAGCSVSTPANSVSSPSMAQSSTHRVLRAIELDRSRVGPSPLFSNVLYWVFLTFLHLDFQCCIYGIRMILHRDFPMFYEGK
jgi:hypothetical protein